MLEEPLRDVYGPHWSTAIVTSPTLPTPDEAVYLPGRNVLLTVKASVWCQLRQIGALALGWLGSNPFPDSTPDFFRDLESVLGRALRGTPRLIRPFDRLHKRDVMLQGRDLPLHLTFSCIDPMSGSALWVLQQMCGAAERIPGRRCSGPAPVIRASSESCDPRGRYAGS